MLFVWEFEIYESGECFVAEPAGDLGGATFGDDFDDAVESAADWLAMLLDDYLIKGIAPPKSSYDNCPTNGGRMVVVAVSRELGDIPAMTASEAAAALGISNARITQLADSGLIDSWKAGGRRMVAKASVDARLEASPKPGRPKETEDV